MNVLVTGGAGYIGSHCCKELRQAGHTPITLDNLVYGHRQAVKWGPFFEGNVADAAVLGRIRERFDIDAIMHFAAYAYVGESVTDPLKYYDNNVRNTIDLLRFAVSQRIDTFIFSSSCATYGIPDRLPITEAHPRRPINPYGRSKAQIEDILADCARASGLRYTSLRYFNAAGADPDGETGEDHDPETHLIPRVLDVAAEQAAAIRVFGTDYDTADGTCVRDYIHVSDLATAHVLALERLVAGAPSDCLNIGTGQGHSIRELIQTVETVTGRPIPVTVCPRRPGDPPVLVADNARARQILGWEPRFDALSDIIRTAWHWHRHRWTSAP